MRTEDTCFEDTDSLRKRLEDLILSIDSDCKSIRFSRPQNLSFELSAVQQKSHLEHLTELIEARRKAVDKVRRSSSIRIIEDTIATSRRKLEELELEIHSLEKDASRQLKALASMQTSALMYDLKQEIANQRRYHADLRRANTEMERQLRIKQRVCSQLEEQMVKSSRGSARHSEILRDEIAGEISVFEDELRILTLEVGELKRRINDST